MSEYEKQANDFLQKHGMTFEAIFIRHGSMSFDKRDKKTGKQDTRDIYTLILSRYTGGLPDLNRKIQYVCSEYGQSIARSGYTPGQLQSMGYNRDKLNPIKGKRVAPTPYDLLAGMTKSDPGTFEEFCSEYGYDEDSISAHETWQAVAKDWKQVRKFFTDEQLEELREIN